MMECSLTLSGAPWMLLLELEKVRKNSQCHNNTRPLSSHFQHRTKVILESVFGLTCFVSGRWRRAALDLAVVFVSQFCQVMGFRGYANKESLKMPCRSSFVDRCPLYRRYLQRAPHGLVPASPHL